ncbi:hypothetical protein EHV15_22155 [Paenibacillus oralis]|uniref:Uncharacterized protein n=1 Tax=Paenibacillus oralis TaxID=2490856 RepID=A0A3P3U551_9BACL|nr:hypothetical protein [Paenibacillus oralis]RRJ65310.1 hypothetical protein EHV15_22155 [Paenibacillus oralis]
MAVIGIAVKKGLIFGEKGSTTKIEGFYSTILEICEQTGGFFKPASEITEKISAILHGRRGITAITT